MEYARYTQANFDLQEKLMNEYRVTAIFFLIKKARKTYLNIEKTKISGIS